MRKTDCLRFLFLTLPLLAQPPGGAPPAGIGSPAAVAVDGKGNVFVALTERRSVSRLDGRTGGVTLLSVKQRPRNLSFGCCL